MTIAELYQIYLQHPIICTDSRKIQANAIFFALKGANFNGNQYAEQALNKGAAIAIIDERTYQKDERYIVVEDVLQTLQALARHHRQQFDIPILAITGSNGKTTTKELIHSVLATQYQTHYTRGNLNNHIGVPLTLLAMPIDTEIAVIEMGANHRQEIEFLCTIALPTHGLITNIGKAHLEGFGGIEGVKLGKSELYRYLQDHEGVAFVNQDEAFLEELAQGISHIVYYHESVAPSLEVIPYEISFLEANPFVKVAFLSPEGDTHTAHSQLIGDYNFNNIKTAIAIGKYFKVLPINIKTAIENYVPSNNRSQIIHFDTNTIILDAYNANPSSMRRALKNLANMKSPQKMAIIGDMLELGDYSPAEHQAILAYALALPSIQTVCTVGKEFEAVRTDQHLHFEDVNALKEWWKNQHLEEYTILLKGSRGIGLEQLLA